MAAPTSYTERQLAEFMHASLGKLAGVLNMRFTSDGPGDFAEAVNDALLQYGSDDITTISGVGNITKIRALARVAIWQYVIMNLAALYDVSVDGGTYNRSQIQKQAVKALELAEAAAFPYSLSYNVRILSLDHQHDPYQVRPEDEFGE